MVRAHAALGSYANQFSMLETPRTTCVACVVQAGHAYWAHVGDSRFYLFRQGALIGATKDHSKVQYLVDQGIIGADEVARASRPQQDLQLPRRPRRSGDRPVEAHAAAQRRRPRAVHRRPVERDSRSDEIATWLTSTPILKTGAADDARGREARRARRRQPVDDHRALGAGDAHRRAVDDDHRDDGPRRVRRRSSTGR